MNEAAKLQMQNEALSGAVELLQGENEALEVVGFQLAFKQVRQRPGA